MIQSYAVSNITPLRIDTPLYTDSEKGNRTSYPSHGGVLFSTKYLWKATASNFSVYNTKTGVKVAAWNFGSVNKDSSTKVVCVEELHRPTGKLPLLIIGLECDVGDGMICIFDVIGSRVLRSIQIGNKVTSVHVIDASYDMGLLPGPLRAFDGILAIGTANGNTLLLDICCQICEEVLNESEIDEIRDEINSCSIKTLFLEDLYSLELHKQVAVKNNEHLAIHLNATYSATEHFVLKGPKGDNRVFVNKEEVVVSALYYCPQLGSLLVGYNFGAWQLWNLISLQLMYTSPVYEDNTPVSHFTLQEPCDDPRAFCYVWVVYSNTEPFLTGFPVAVLYSLNYSTKQWHEGYGILYQDLTSCAVRFQTDLVSLDEKQIDNTNTQQGAHCLRLQSINKIVSKNPLQDQHEETIALCCIVWSEWNYKLAGKSQTYMGLFDLNQWYKAQMPSSPKSKVCETYMTQVCLTDLLNAVNSQFSAVLDVRIDVETISQFLGSQRLEEHYHPSSLAFQLCALRERDIATFNNQGTQRAFLSSLESAGPLALLKPSQLFIFSLNLGLSPLFLEVPCKTSPSIEYQREYLLSVALEQKLLAWLCRCARVWGSGAHAVAGCSLQVLLSWGWQRAQSLKLNANTLTTPLFDYSESRFDPNAFNLLSNCARQLKNLATLFAFVVERLTKFVLNLDVVKYQSELLQNVSTHLEVIQWLLNVGLLPEHSLKCYPKFDEFNRINTPYPEEALSAYYNERRTSLQMQNKDCGLKEKNILFIDNLIDIEFGGYSLRKQWEIDGGIDLYPPHSLQALMRTYLIENVDMQLKHCLLIYVFLDLAMTLTQDEYKSTITHLIKFPAVFCLTPSIIKITQAFWQLDHEDFSTAIEQLLDPLVSNKDLKIWHHRTALNALFVQKQYSRALLYLQVRQPPVTEVQDLCTVLSLFVANNMLDDAFHFQRQNGNKMLLHHFYKECDKNNKIKFVLHLPLTAKEEASFMKYLNDIKHPELEELQILYYIEHSQYTKAYELREEFNAVKPDSMGLYGQENVGFCYHILSSLSSGMPNISKELMKINKNNDGGVWKEVKRPKPFSVFVHNNKQSVQYSSTIIHAGLLKAKETWSHPILDDNKIAKNEEMPFFNILKATPVSNRAATPLIYSNVINVEVEIAEEGPTPAKRFKPSSRLTNNSPESNRSVMERSNNFDIYNKELHTPLVERVKSKIFPKETSIPETPQSILKVRNFIRKSDSPKDEIDTTPKPSTINNFSSNVTIRRKSQRVSARKSLCELTRPAVRFNFSRSPSESSVTSNTGGPSFEILREEAIVHALPESDIAGKSNQSNSLSTEDTYYTPDALSHSQVENKEEILKNQFLNEKALIRNSLTEASEKELKSRRSDNKELDEINKDESDICAQPKQRVSSKSMEEITSIEPEVEDNLQLPSKSEIVLPSTSKTPRSRKSYKDLLPESQIRKSPRLRKISQLDESELQEKDVVEKSPAIVHTPAKDSASELNSTLTLKRKSSALTTPKSRISLTRRVLEQNLLNKILEQTPMIENTEVEKSTVADESLKDYTNTDKLEDFIEEKYSKNVLNFSASDTIYDENDFAFVADSVSIQELDEISNSAEVCNENEDDQQEEVNVQENKTLELEVDQEICSDQEEEKLNTNNDVDIYDDLSNDNSRSINSETSSETDLNYALLMNSNADDSSKMISKAITINDTTVQEDVFDEEQELENNEAINENEVIELSDSDETEAMEWEHTAADNSDSNEAYEEEKSNSSAASLRQQLNRGYSVREVYENESPEPSTNSNSSNYSNDNRVEDDFEYYEVEEEESSDSNSVLNQGILQTIVEEPEEDNIQNDEKSMSSDNSTIIIQEVDCESSQHEYKTDQTEIPDQEVEEITIQELSDHEIYETIESDAFLSKNSQTLIDEGSLTINYSVDETNILDIALGKTVGESIEEENEEEDTIILNKQLSANNTLESPEMEPLSISADAIIEKAQETTPDNIATITTEEQDQEDLLMNRAFTDIVVEEDLQDVDPHKLTIVKDTFTEKLENPENSQLEKSANVTDTHELQFSEKFQSLVKDLNISEFKEENEFTPETNALNIALTPSKFNVSSVEKYKTEIDDSQQDIETIDETDVLDETDFSELNILNRGIDLDFSGIPLSASNSPMSNLEKLDSADKTPKSPGRRSRRVSNLIANVSDATTSRRITRSSSINISDQITPNTQEKLLTSASPSRKRGIKSYVNREELPKRRLRSSSVTLETPLELSGHKRKGKRASSEIVDLSLANVSSIDKTKPDSITKSGSKTSHRKSKSVVSTPTNLETLQEYSTSRRLTRRQASLLEKTLNVSNITDLDISHLHDIRQQESDNSETEQRGPIVEQLDPIYLLDKKSFDGKPDSDEEKEVERSPRSSIPESPIGSKTKTRSTTSNMSPHSEISVSISESSKRKRRLFNVKRSLVLLDDSVSSRTRQRSKSTDEPLLSVDTKHKVSPKLRKTRRNSKEVDSCSDISIISQTQSLIEGGSSQRRGRKVRSISSQAGSPLCKSGKQSVLVKPELPKIMEEQSQIGSSSTKSSGRTKK